MKTIELEKTNFRLQKDVQEKVAELKIRKMEIQGYRNTEQRYLSTINKLEQQHQYKIQRFQNNIDSLRDDIKLNTEVLSEVVDSLFTWKKR